MGQQGAIFTADTAKNYLKEANKNYLGQQTWLEAYKAIDDASQQIQSDYLTQISDIDTNASRQISDLSISASRAENALLKDYSSDISAAYKAAEEQRRSIAGSELGQGYKSQALTGIDYALEGAYNSYLQNFMLNKSDIKSSLISNSRGVYNSAISAKKDATNYANDSLETLEEGRLLIDEALEEHARNTADYLNAHFDYLSELYERNPNAFLDDSMQDFVNREMKGGVWKVTGLKDIGEIRQAMSVYNNGSWELTPRGIDFFSQVQAMGYGDDVGYTFADYLFENNKDLYDWSVSDNKYDATYKDSFNRSTNRTGALGSVGLGKDGVIADEGYQWKGGTVEDNLKKNKSESVTYDSAIGNLDYYNTDSGDTLIVPQELKIKGNPKNKDNNNFHVEYGGKDYYLELVNSNKNDDAILDDKYLTDIYKTLGGINENQLYYYKDNLYFSFVNEDGSIQLRKVQGQGGSGTFDTGSTNKTYKELIDNIRNSQDYRNSSFVKGIKYRDNYIKKVVSKSK